MSVPEGYVVTGSQERTSLLGEKYTVQLITRIEDAYHDAHIRTRDRHLEHKTWLSEHAEAAAKRRERRAFNASPFKARALRAKRLAGRTIRSLAKESGMSEAAVSKRIRWARDNAGPHERRREVLMRYERGEKVTSIARDFGVGTPRIYQLLRLAREAA